MSLKIKKVKSKQIVIIALVVLIAAAAYIQYGYNPSGNSSGDISDLSAINTPAASETRKMGEAVAVSKETNAYFAQSKIDKESMRSKNIDVIKEIAQDPGSDKEIKAEANKQLLQLTSHSEKEMKIEALIKEKGYEDVLVYLGDDDTADVIVKAPSLNASQTAQIYDIVMRHAKITGDKLSVKNMY